MTSHQAFFTKEALTNIAQTTLQNIKDYFEGKPLKNEICYNCGQPRENCSKMKGGKRRSNDKSAGVNFLYNRTYNLFLCRLLLKGGRYRWKPSKRLHSSFINLINRK